MDKWVFATKNPHKFSEVCQIVGSAICIETLPPDVEEAPEPYSTLYENALSKAAFYADRLRLPVIAEDSGLFVPALGGRPGVHTARLGGPERLLELMQGVQDRRAYFVSVMVAYRSPDQYLFSTGFWQGSIALKPAGQAGFGYDPVFVPHGYSDTVAQLGVAWKLQHSHRTRALHKLLVQLSQK
ncbi:MAG: non-canonical purine NTP pyrophosphatase [Bacteroidia bacterium]|nr:non-canonical purine NTP pyrophosphatase [Bacteroidia bacterium]